MDNDDKQSTDDTKSLPPRPVTQAQVTELWAAINHTRVQMGQPELGPNANS